MSIRVSAFLGPPRVMTMDRDKTATICLDNVAYNGQQALGFVGLPPNAPASAIHHKPAH